MRRATVVILIVVVAVAAVLSLPSVRRFRRRLAGQKLYERAFAAYMLGDVERSETTFGEVASRYGDLAIGSMAQLKIAFMAYDEHKDADRAEELFRAFLDEHPDGLLRTLDSPLPDYEGELELVAYYFLGRIALDRGDTDAAREWLERIADRGSCNPANVIVAASSDLLRKIEARAGERSVPQ